MDEHQDDRDAAVAAEGEARAELAKANAFVAAADAKVLSAQADVADAKADVKVAQAELENARVMVRFATITSPYTGVITYRRLFPGDYVKAATDSGGSRPLLTVERTDKMRVVYQMADRDVPYCNVGDRAVVEIDALPGPPLEAKVSRMASSEDTGSLLMHVEIDLANPTRKIAQGMFGHITVFLDQGADLLSVPSTCLTGKDEHGKGSVLLVRNGKAVLTSVVTGTDNGVRIAIPKGLKVDDEVVLHPTDDLVDGTAVVAVPEPPEKAKTH